MAFYDGEELVTVVLVDFLKTTNCCDHDDRNNDDSPTTSLIIQQEIDWLKNSLRKQKTSFSYRFENPTIIAVPETELRYDVRISYRYNCLIAVTSDFVYIFDKKAKVLINSFAFKGVLVMTIDEEHDEIFVIFGSDDDDGYCYNVQKYKLGEFIKSDNKEKKPKPVWSAEETCSNPYGAAVFSGLNTRYLIVLDNFETDLKIYSCESGSLINNTYFSVHSYGYSLGMASRKELIIGCSEVIQIYEIDEKSFGSNQQGLKLAISKEITGSPEYYSIIHDELNRKIILSNVNDNTITVLSRDNLELVQKYQEKFDDISGACLDVNTGELYICFSKGIVLYK